MNCFQFRYNFGFNLNLRRYNQALSTPAAKQRPPTSELLLAPSRHGLTLVHFSAQFEHFWWTTRVHLSACRENFTWGELGGFMGKIVSG